MRHTGFFRHLLVRKAVKTGEILIDLVTTTEYDSFDFAGWVSALLTVELDGTIAGILAPVAEKVVGVEIVEEAVEAAKENVALDGLSNCTFWAGDVLKVIDELGEKPDLIVLDPPRDGVHPKALEKSTNFGVEKMVYIACKPTSLARDMEMLQGRGYQVGRIACVDLSPRTYHIDTCYVAGITA